MNEYAADVASDTGYKPRKFIEISLQVDADEDVDVAAILKAVSDLGIGKLNRFNIQEW